MIRTALATLAAVVSLAACSSSSPAAHSTTVAPTVTKATVPTKPPKRTVVGTMTIGGGGFVGNGFRDGAHCSGDSGYDDIDRGAEVTISDDAGRTLAITQLRGGHVYTYECQFKFTAKVPAGKHFYGIQVTHRGVVKFSEAELGNAALTIGE